MITQKSWIYVVLLLFTHKYVTDSLEVDCDQVVISKFCDMMVKNSECSGGTCQCVNGFRESNGTCINLKDEQYELMNDKVVLDEPYELINEQVEIGHLVREDIIGSNNNVFEMDLPNLNELSDADEYLERYRRQDGGSEGCGDEASFSLPFGSSDGDSSAGRFNLRNNQCFRLRLRYRIPFFETWHNQIFVCENGCVSFGRRFRSTRPPRNRQRRPYLNNRYLACAYHDDIDVSSTGTVWHQIYDITSGTLPGAVAATAQGLVLANFNINIAVYFVLKVVWSECPRRGGPTSETVSVQLLYISDYSRAYVFYFYDHEKMLFALTSTQQFLGIVNNGFPTAVPDSADFKRNKRPDINIKDINGRYGIVYYDVSRPRFNFRRRICWRWYARERNNLGIYRSARARMPRCPCTWFIAVLLNAFRPVSFTNNVWTFATMPGFNYFPYGQTCTYFRFGRLITSQGSTGRFQRYNQLLFPASHRNDLWMRNMCCSSNLCSLYWDVRPRVLRCIRFFIFIAFGFGDPHFVTLDGLKYTFNGLGEYILLKHNTAEPKVEIQTRTAKLKKDDGSLSQATIFSGYAVKVGNNFLQTEIIEGEKELMSVMYKLGDADWVDVSDDYKNMDLSVVDDNNELNLYIQEKALVASFPSIGLQFSVTPSEGFLKYGVSFSSDDLKGQLVGLLGNFNGVKTDDLIPRLSTTPISDQSTEKEIFNQFGKSWITKADESIFLYVEGKDHGFYSKPDFTPVFFDDIPQEKIDEAINLKICSSAEDKQCIYDYAVTDKASVAGDTNTAVIKADEDKAEAANQVPSIEPTSGVIEKEDLYYINVLIDESKEISIEGEDDGTMTFELVDTTADVTLTSTATTATITFTITDENPVNLSVIAKDNKNVESPPIEFVIVLCTGCNKNGICDYNNVRTDDRETDTFKYATCTCEDYYDGDDCENDLDACEGSPCADRTCTDTVAANHKANPNLEAFTCGACPDGYEPDSDGYTCNDIDECEAPSPCNQGCQNSDGSFTCECNTGYRLADNKKDCQDINECEESTSGCQQICTNSEGGFTCSCRQGFTYNAEKKQCEKDAVLPTGCDAIDCSNAEGCTLDSDNKAICFCKAGFLLQGDNSCTNVDECSLVPSPCSQVCKDQVGSFTCSCHIGFNLQEDKVSCKACESPFYGVNCANKCDCGTGALDCDPVRGCVCDSGYTGADCKTDVNECEVDLNICQDTNKECVNSIGSYECNCRAGYQEDDNGNCVDIDECMDVDLNICEKDCTNTPGSFSCGCPSGYKVDPSNATKCLDIDECAEGNSGCEHTCVNNPGRFSCLCKAGFDINIDRRTCTLAENPCKDFPDISCTHICQLVDDKPKCSCRIGFTLGDDVQTCIDINECDNNDLNKCTETDTCVNQNGGYSCSCKAGSKLENDKRTCIPCETNLFYGVNCAKVCGCGPGAEKCDPVLGCVCKEGWVGEKCDADKDECVTSPCTKANTKCVNIPESFQCVCKDGFELIDDKCADINECTSSAGKCEQKCDNTVGSFECSCFSGFVLKDDKCEDIDECQASNDCTQLCTNTIGRYRCTCNPGFVLDLMDRVTCKAEAACSTDKCGSNVDCASVSGVDTCTCKSGFKFVTGSDTTCEDIAECAADPSPCSQQCLDEPAGSYTCSCNLAGFKLATDGTTCIECTDNKYGLNCAQTCACVIENTKECSNVDGTCTCNDGWKGDTCNENINECETVTCPDKSVCRDMQGSYFCKCNSGYFLTSENVCQVCSEGKYGENCAETCSCDVQKTEKCNTVSGACTCNGGWEGTNCEQNINECTRNTFDCPEDSTCEDAEGSFICNCNIGYIKTADNKKCDVCEQWTYGEKCSDPCPCVRSNSKSCNNVDGTCECKDGWEGATCNLDIDECTRNTFTCPDLSTCKNTDGSYTCECNAGYKKDDANENCIDIDECEAGTDTCNQNCTNTIGSFVCSCNTGFSGTGNDCTQCVATWGIQCANQCQCDEQNSERCDHVTGCVCRTGWKGVSCTEDADECDNNPCSTNEFCTNTDGSFTCACKDGYKKQQNVCKACTNNSYQKDCNRPCNCVDTNARTPSQACDHVNGTCLCTQFWEGVRCQTDINECTRNTDNCTKDNEGCHNTEGGFECSCVLGYVRDANGNCVTDTSPAVTTTPAPASTVSINIVLTLDHSVIGNILITLTNTQYQNEFRTKMVLYLQRRLGFIVIIIINSLRSGSLVADYNVVVPQNSLPDFGKANSDLISNKENLNLFNQTSPVTKASIENTSIPAGSTTAPDELACKSYEASIKNCNSGYSCVISSGSPACEPVEEDNFPLTFGLGFGIPMFLLCALAIFVIAMYLRSRNKKRTKNREIPDDRSSSLFGHRLPVRVITGGPGPFSGTPEIRGYEPSEHSSEASDFDYRIDRFDDDRGRPGQSTWNYLFHNSRADDTKYHIRRPKVDKETWGRYTYDNYY